MLNAEVIPFAPVLARRRPVMAAVSLASWHNHFPDGIEDLWDGPFARVAAAAVIPLRVV